MCSKGVPAFPVMVAEPVTPNKVDRHTLGFLVVGKAIGD